MLQRVDQAAVAQHDLHLPVEELDVAAARRPVLPVPRRRADQPLDDAALEQVLLDDLRGVFGLDVLVEDAVRVDGATGPTAQGPRQPVSTTLDLVAQALLVQSSSLKRGA